MKNTTTFLISFTLFLLLSLSVGVSANAAKIAVASTGPEKDAAISEQTGRAPFFLFFDAKGNFLEAVDNPAKGQSGGMRRAISSLLINKGATTIITGKIGDKMKQKLETHHISQVIKTGNADQTVKAVVQSR